MKSGVAAHNVLGIGDSNSATFVFLIESTFLETDRSISKKQCAAALYIAVLAMSFGMRWHGKIT